jgi:hypothetical protein
MYSTLVRYGGPKLARRVVYPYATRIGMAFRRYALKKRVARRVFRKVARRVAYGTGAAAGAAAVIQRRFRKSRKFSVKSDKVPTTKVTDIQIPDGQTTVGILNTYPVPISARSGDRPNERRNNQIWLSGIKYCWVFNTLKQALNQPSINLDVHFACVQITGSPAVTGQWGNNEILLKIQDQFFRERTSNTGDPDQRTRQFNQATDGSAYDFLKTCGSLASDDFTVLFHKSFPLYARYNTTQIPEGGKTYRRKIEGYMKINKKFSFFNNTSQVGIHPIVFIYWCNPLTRDEWPTAYTVNPNRYLATESRIQVYFKDLP